MTHVPTDEVDSLKFECRFSGVCRTLFDIVRFVKLEERSAIVFALSSDAYNDSVPLNLVDNRFFLDDDMLAFEATVLLPEAAFEYSVRGKNLARI